MRVGRLTVIAGILALAAILIPYLVCRISAPSRRVVVFSSENVHSPTSDMLRVATYNIAHGRGLAGVEFGWRWTRCPAGAAQSDR